jgi:putative aminopeptidase FrvX
MHDASLAFLHNLLNTPSPSGYERPIQDVVRAWASPLSDSVQTDRHGNVIAALNPSGSPRILLAGHCDQIGLMVQHIDECGFLYVQPIGGWDMQILLGQKLTVWTKHRPVAAVVSRRAMHLLTNEERNKVPLFTDVWLDIGAKDRKEAQDLIRVGDPVTFELGVRELRNGCITSPGLDDKVGVWTVMETLRLLRDRPLQAAVFCVSTVQEEVGLRGASTSAYGVNPAVGIAVDVCHATDTPGNDKKQLGECKLGGGPALYRGPNISPRVFDLLETASQNAGIPFQLRGAPRATGTDANVIQITREGVAVGLIGVPNRYMHTPVEICALEDLDQSAKLLAEFCTSVTAETDWTP